MELANNAKYSYGYDQFLACVESELSELVLDQRFFPFTDKPTKMNEEEKEAYDICIDANKTVFGPLLKSQDPRSISKLAYYILDQGLRARIAHEVH